MLERPSGTVTFVFTDVERSTSLLGRLGADAYAEELARHRSALRRAWTEHGGVEVDTQGDSFFVAFARAGDALAAARAAQDSLAGTGIAVRIGIHTGEPLVTPQGYVGMDVHRAARIAAAAHGGQILLSRATCDLVAADDLVDLGEHRLKDLTRPERLFQVGSESFPPLRTLNASTLPEAANPIVGRAAEQGELAQLLRHSRLVTITGAGGTGKTRLALQVAADLLDEFPDGVRFVPLAGLSDPAIVLPIALQTLGVTDPNDPVPLRALLVLDNFEHILPAAPAVAMFLSRSAGPTVLVTSRTPLHVSMEVEYPLDPLRPAAAVELFLDRALTIRRTIQPTRDVREICRRLDGLPLALELAAARLKVLDPPALLKRLDSSLSLLTHGPADLPERQQTLEATIAWSYDLLDADARRVFERLSVFASTFGLEAAEAVADADLDSLTALVDASLIRSRGDGRFLVLDTIRAFARSRVSDETAVELPPRHAAFYLKLAEEAEKHLTGPEAATWLTRLEADYGNLRSALDWLVLDSPASVPRFVMDLWRFWLIRGRFEEGETAIRRALALDPPAADQAELLYRLGAIVISRGRTEQGRGIFQQALAGFRAQGLSHGEARSLSAMGHVATDAGDWSAAIGYYEQATAMFRTIDDRLGLAGVLGDLATVHLRSGAPERARPLAEESLRLQREVGNRQGEMLALATLGYADLRSGDAELARRELGRATEIARDLGYRHGLLYSLNGLAALAVRRGERSRALRTFRAAAQLRAMLEIEHDPDDVLIALDRAAVGAEDASGLDDDFDLDESVAEALED